MFASIYTFILSFYIMAVVTPALVSTSLCFSIHFQSQYSSRALLYCFVYQSHSSLLLQYVTIKQFWR